MEKKVMMNQKEYLKKYLSSGVGDEKRKKKKKLKVGAKSVKVIDDDIDLKNMRPIDDSEIDIFIDAEDAPQIAGIVDERGPVDFTDKRRWKIIANDDNGDLTVTCHDKGSRKPKTVQNGSDNGLSPPRTSKSLKRQSHDMNVKEGKDDDSDLSPPRRKSKKYKTSQNSGSDGSVEADIPVHKMRKKGKRKQDASDSDLSPPRQSKNYDSDLSPPRKSRKQRSQKNIRDMNKSDSDASPPRRSRKDKFENSKKKHRKGYDSDLSPPRKHKKGSDSDLSPPRKNRKGSDSDLSPPRKHKKGSDSDLSPPRKHRKGSDLDLSPPRKHKHKESRRYKYSDKNSRSGRKNYESDSSPPQRKDREKDGSSGRFRENDRDSNKSKKSRWNSEYEHNAKRHSHIENSHKNEKYEKYTSGKRKLESKRRDIHEEDGEKRMKKTLDGKTAGLQDARALREETEAHKIREAEQFSKLSKEVTGVGQATVVRNSKTGKKRNLEAEAAEEREKQKRQTELDEKYAKWGRGLKQVEDREEKLKDDLYEMSKPLARYADDADLDKRLREQEREGDPMLEYIKQKQIKEGKRKPDLPKYEGSFMPNRFGIKPGHRWDGVDRSNGYEKRWFEAQNAKKARHEEAYKWSTSDM